MEPPNDTAASARADVIAVLVDTAFTILRTRGSQFASKPNAEERSSPRRSGAQGGTE